MYPLLESVHADVVSQAYGKIRLPIIDFKADWPALVEMTGLRTWAHSTHPCPCCLAKKKDLDSICGYTSHSTPHTLFDNGLYEASVLKNFKEPLFYQVFCYGDTRYQFLKWMLYKGLYIRLPTYPRPLGDPEFRNPNSEP